MSATNALNNLVKSFPPASIMKTVKFISCDKGNCVATVKLTDEHVNFWGGLSGGCAYILVDGVSVSGLLVGLKDTNSWATPVSVNINLSYLKSAKSGDEIKIISNLLRAGKNMAFLDVEIRNAATEDLLVKGQHTMFNASQSRI